LALPGLPPRTLCIGAVLGGLVLMAFGPLKRPGSVWDPCTGVGGAGTGGARRGQLLVGVEWSLIRHQRGGGIEQAPCVGDGDDHWARRPYTGAA